MKSIVFVVVLLFGVCAASPTKLIGSKLVGSKLVKRQAGSQNPKVWDALDVLRGRSPLTIPQILDLYSAAVPGKDYPINAVIPQPNGVDKNIPGFFADESSQCQGFHRVDLNGEITSYLCPNQTLFNQITLICDWWYNIDCSKSAQFAMYSNSRLVGEGQVLLDNQDIYEIQEATGAAVAAEAPKRKRKQSAGSA